MARPTDAEGWIVLRNEVNEAFSPGAPIRARTELAGRYEQIQRLSDIMLRAGEHAIVFGERGVGKTSIGRTFHAGLNTPTRRVEEIHVNCVKDDEYTSLWRKVFRRLGHIHGDNGPVSPASLYDDKVITPDDVQNELTQFSINDLPIIIFDEFDRIADAKTKDLMTDTIKMMSDYGSHCKLVMIGVAEDVSELISQHASLSRNLKQVRMPRLSLNELQEIVVQRLKRCGLAITDEAVFQVAFLSRGLPYFCHLVGQYAALAGVENRRTVIGEQDVLRGLTSALHDVDQTITEAYLRAVISQRHDESLYEPVLVACALADADELGRFQQSAVSAPLAQIVSKTPPYTAATFAFHMNEFCEEKRGPVLERSGEARNYRYRFRDPMMQPYVIIRALEAGRLKMETFEKFTARRQLKLSI